MVFSGGVAASNSAIVATQSRVTSRVEDFYEILFKMKMSKLSYCRSNDDDTSQNKYANSLCVTVEKLISSSSSSSLT